MKIVHRSDIQPYKIVLQFKKYWSDCMLISIILLQLSRCQQKTGSSSYFVHTRMPWFFHTKRNHLCLQRFSIIAPTVWIGQFQLCPSWPQFDIIRHNLWLIQIINLVVLLVCVLYSRVSIWRHSHSLPKMVGIDPGME